MSQCLYSFGSADDMIKYGTDNISEQDCDCPENPLSFFICFFGQDVNQRPSPEDE